VPHVPPHHTRKKPAPKVRLEDRFEDEARFLRTWFDRPLVTGAVSPSGKALARLMASYVDPGQPGPVIELGPGTGALTEALVERGISPDRLVLVEYDRDFCRLLKQRYPEAQVIQGDAYNLSKTLDARLREPASAVISGLPLFTKPEHQRLALLHTSFDLMHPMSPFIQFTYAVVSPMPLKQGGFHAKVSPRVWMNIPPACVWVYRRPLSLGPPITARPHVDLFDRIRERGAKMRTQMLR
jgi:phosphatidylethanolamine/phosphatidyl-N-methylethanolamine N-methyltransferase